MKKTSVKKQKKKSISYRTVFLIIFTAFIAIYPFICRLLIKKVSAEENKVFSTTNGYIVDFCNYSKEAALFGFTIFLIAYFLGEHIFPDKIEKINFARLKSLRFPMICIGGYILLTIISFCFSPHKSTALWGSNQEYEGLIAIICYGFLFLFSIYYYKTESALKILRIGILAMCLTVGLLSIVEIFWKPILEFTFVQDFISNENQRELAHSITCENFIGQISLLFHNPAYLGGFCSLFIPIVLGITLSDTEQSNKKTVSFYLKQILFIIIPALLGLALIWSRSSVSAVCLVISLAIIILLYLLYSKKTNQLRFGFKQLLIRIAVPAVLGLVLVVISNILPNSITYKHEKGMDSTIEEFSVEKTASSSSAKKFKLVKATLDKGVLRLESDKDVLIVSMDLTNFFACRNSGSETGFEKCLVFNDGTSNINGLVPAVMKATSIQGELSGFKLSDERYDAITFSCQEELLIFDFGYDGTVEFYMTERGIMIFGQGSTLLDHIPQPKVTGFESIYGFATGRGYTWTQSLPVLADCLLLGNGNGTFAFHFVQNEIVGLLNTHGSCKYVVDRPHNWYIQVAVSSGIPALLFMLAAFIFYIFRYIKGFLHSRSDISVFQIGIFAGLLSFMVFGIINDSFITVFPFFWIFFGVGVGNLGTVSSGHNKK